MFQRNHYTEVRTVAKTFIQLGRQKYTTVCILGFNSPEWIISNVAAIFASTSCPSTSISWSCTG